MNTKYWIAILATVLPSLAFAQADDSLLNDEFVVSQEFVEGEVVRVQPISRTITIRGANRGDRRQFTVPENTRITVDGRQARLRDIRRGDEVSVSIVRRQQQLVVDRLRVPEPESTLEERRENPIVASESLPASLPSTASNDALWLIAGVALLATSGLLIARRRYRNS